MSRLDLSQVDVEHLLTSIGVRNLSRPTMDYWLFSCPFAGHAHGDETPSAQMHDEHTGFNCFGCKRTGNAVTFLAEYEGVSIMEARRWLRDEYGSDFREPQDGAAAEWMRRFEESDEGVLQTYLEESVLDRYAVDWADAYMEWWHTKSDGALGYMFSRGFEPETLMDWGIGFDDFSQRFTIPVRDERGELCGFKARAWHPEARPKYLALGDVPGRPERFGFPTYEKSLIVFGLDRAESDDGTLILCEGELNVISMWQKGWRNAVAIAGSALSDAQAQLLRDHCDEVVLFFDTDPAGFAAAWGTVDEKTRRRKPGAVDALEPFMRVRVVRDHNGDPASMGEQDILGCVSEADGSVSARARVLG